MNNTAQELFEILNDQDECPWIEAKGGSDSSHSVMETVCAFANQPGLGGGYILMGVSQDRKVLFKQYKDSTTVSTQPFSVNTQPFPVNTQPPEISTPPPNFEEKSNIADIETNTELSTQPPKLSTPPVDLSTPPVDLSTPPQSILIEESLKKENI